MLTSRTGVVTSSAASSRRTAGWPRTPSTPPSPTPASTAGPCRTRRLPLLGAAPRARLAGLEQPARLVRRFGTDAALVLDTAREVSGLGDDELLAPIADGVPVTLAELVFGVTHEGAADVDDLLDRRTRVGLVPADRGSPYPPPSARLRDRCTRTDELAPPTDEFRRRRRSVPTRQTDDGRRGSETR